jgi:hypothetical protein
MYVSHSRNAVYLAIPRTASRSISAWFRLDYGAIKVNGHHGHRADPAIKDYLAFTSVRNPYDRLASWYKFTKKADDLFELIKEHRLVPQACWLDKWQQAFSRPITIIHYENLNEELRTLPFVDKEIVLPQIGVEGHLSWQEAYRTQEVLDYVYENWKIDFDQLNYSKHSRSRRASESIPRHCQ